MTIKINDKTLGAKATELIEKYKETTGHTDEARVVEECIFAVYELLKLAEERSKTEPTIPVEAFLGIISTFQRFGKVDFGY